MKIECRKLGVGVLRWRWRARVGFWRPEGRLVGSNTEGWGCERRRRRRKRRRREVEKDEEG